MRSSVRTLSVVMGMLAVFCVGNVMAQVPQQSVSSPAIQATPAVKTVFDYQKELGLSDKQVADLKKVMTDFQTKMTDFQTKMTGLRQELANLIQKKADMKMIRRQAEKVSALQVDATCADIETSRTVETIMTLAQITQWKEIQDKSRQEMQEQMNAARAAQAAPEPVKTK